MPKTSFEKTRKAIAKKKGPIESLHQYSRDSKRLHRAQVRDEKLEKIAASRRKNDQLYRTYVHQYDEELDEIRKSRRKGRPASTKEDLLKMKIESLQKEWHNGFRQYL
ncbi:hypothetical protein DL770_008704 [Monosporascus sp. CRB-9-2]|nr:hypothetical protein DL770_008704 [Monosporascus sp. CRB-9-2]